MLKNTKDKIKYFLGILFYISGLSYFRFLYLKESRGPLVRVLCFHDIKSQENFDKLVSCLDRRFNIVSPVDFKNKDLNEDKLNILLTFDDGYKSWLENVLPVLKEKDLKGVFFICSGLLKAEKRGEEGVYLREQLKLEEEITPTSWNDVKSLDKNGMEIGGHTLNHFDLTRLDKSKGEEEIKEDKNLLEEKLEKNIDFFAYPFGYSSSDNYNIVSQVKDTGYSYGFTTNLGFNSDIDGNYKLNRDCIDSEESLFLNLVKIYGSYDIFG